MTPAAIDLRHLRYFVAVSEELHFGRAAQRLHIAQPPLSQAIRKLEDELGVLLLHRTSRVVELTEAGRVFAAEAQQVLVSLDDAVVRTRRAGGAGAVLRIGCVPFWPVGRLFLLLAALSELDPSAQPQMTHLLQLDQIRRLRAGRLDIGIFNYSGEQEGLEQQAICPGEPLSLFLPAAHPLARRDVVRPDDLQDEVLVAFASDASPALFEYFLNQLDELGYRFRTVLEGGGASPRDMLVAVARGDGVSIAPFHQDDGGEIASLVVQRRLDPVPVMSDTVLAWCRNPPRQLFLSPRALAERAERLLRESTAEPAEALAAASKRA